MRFCFIIAVLSEIMVEIHKKYVLVSLILNGEVDIVKASHFPAWRNCF